MTKTANTIQSLDRITLPGFDRTLIVNWAQTKDGVTTIWVNPGQFTFAPDAQITVA